MVYQHADWERVPETAASDQSELYIPENKPVKFGFNEPILINQSGYIYIWLSNESKDTRVWFDDLTVTHTQNLVVQASDYGVWGDLLREQKSDERKYRFGYQGQFAEKDEETGWDHFELREYDAVIGRWSVPDPLEEFFSPYLNVSNNPLINVDPSGGVTSPIFGFNGKFLGVDSEGYSGDIIVMDENLYNGLTGNGTKTLDHSDAVALASDPDDNRASFLAVASINLRALSTVYTHVLSQMNDIDLTNLHGGQVSIYNNYTIGTTKDGNPIWGGYNNLDNPGRYRGRYLAITVNINYQDELSTVEIIQSYLGIHEWQAHNVECISGGKDHYKAWEMQKAHKTFDKLPERLQAEINGKIRGLKP